MVIRFALHYYRPEMNLLIHQGALGDWVLTFPILRALSGPKPGAGVEPGPTLTVAPASKARLAARLIPNVLPVDIEQQDFTLLHVPEGWQRVSQARREQFAQIDGVIVSFVSSGTGGRSAEARPSPAAPQAAWAANMARLAPRAKIVSVEPRCTDGDAWSGHIGAWHAEQLRRQGVVLAEVPVELCRNVDGPIVLHLGSGGLNKQWPIKRWLVLHEMLASAGQNPVLIAGEAEQERWARQQVVVPPDCRFLSTLEELYDLLATARLFIGQDAGPTHLAAQMGMPTIALFGPTSPVRWAPIGPVVTVLAPPQLCPMDWLDTETVAATAQRLLSEFASARRP